MTKKFFMLLITVCLVLSISLSSSTSCHAASNAGAYKAKSTFCVYINAFDAATGNGTYASWSNFSGYTVGIRVNAGKVFTAGSNGVIKIPYNGGYVYVYAPDGVKAGKLTKLY